MQTLAKYRNGNCDVTIYEDGTKVIDYDPPAAPEFPLSIDLKITDKCDQGCWWCHESSTPDGKHARMDDILRVVDGLPCGTELAIGGGDPMAYPDIGWLLPALKSRGLIANMTINAAHAKRYHNRIWSFRVAGWLHGLGISWSQAHAEDVKVVADSNTVLHLIAGIHSVDGAVQLLNDNFKVLVLGYKHYGRGAASHDDAVDTSLAEWRSNADRLLSTPGTIAFDTLALEQLDIRSYVPRDVWDRNYMGDDGEFTMYVDAVSREYSKSSTSNRRSTKGMSIKELFQDVRK